MAFSREGIQNGHIWSIIVPGLSQEFVMKDTIFPRNNDDNLLL